MSTLVQTWHGWQAGDPRIPPLAARSRRVVRYSVGAAIWLVAIAGLLAQQGVLREGMIAGLALAGATALGALPVAFARKLPAAMAQQLLLAGGGIMLAASFFSLLWPAFQQAAAQTGSHAQAVLMTLAVAALGAGLLALWRRRATRQAEGSALQRTGVLLFVWAIALHNLPEGLAGGVAMAGQAHGATLVVGIGLQDIPEGFAVAAALLQIGISPLRAAAWGAASGLVELLGAVAGAAAVAVTATALPVLLALAGGAMLWVTASEIGPLLRRNRTAEWLFAGGFALMAVMDLGLG
ncbi:zinc transporter, ZIP family [Andreprevotia lacus DSM 23236]|jgi:ZIP family zinc transporter|uniref:Zinc transporter, ZIP family n=1 Tax=Andreprevotia lacus DSM 23236 TaxID=1121001 RepID=A0A1W1XVL1_9NEIS|nr:ZIP family metal transporter [Andreprevotia lacus]SMC27973.1 zinc transporter, ZIP family [Andreprevotia lacus DSM 23236]